MTTAAATTARTIYATEESDQATVERSTAHRDRQGRVIGGACRIATVRFVDRPEGQTWGRYMPDCAVDMVAFSYCPTATRNGVTYGASQSTMYFATAALRDAAVAKYFDGMEKRAAKTAAKA
jgi:hypothetical protein